jgi:hypothetical protein
MIYEICKSISNSNSRFEFKTKKREKEFKIKQKGKKRNESGAYWARFYPISAQHGAVRAAQPSRRNHGADRWALWVGHTRW